jgi:hypothetical protein
MFHMPGYQSGASLRMWQDRFPKARVYGLDKLLVHVPGFSTAQCDQSKPEELRVWAMRWGPFDLVVDDGSHDPADQINTFKTLIPYVREGGLYIMEDVVAVAPMVTLIKHLSREPLTQKEPHDPNTLAHCIVIEC